MVTDIAAPVDVCFDLARSIDLHLESMIASEERAVAGVTSGLIAGGEEVSWEARHFGITWHMTSRITEFDPPHRFVDEMVRGPFTAFRHVHEFEARYSRTRMTDAITFGMPVGFLMNPPVGLYLRRLMRIRNEAISRKAETAEP
jgi:ligand-binding SRPBCC domain-containing protein